MKSPLTFCLGCCNNLNYLKLAVHSVRTYSHFKDAPFIIFAENCTDDGTYEWLETNAGKYNLTWFKEDNNEENTKGIGGSMNFCAGKVETEYILFLHADMFVAQDWDSKLLELFSKYPNQKLWVNSQRFQPNCFKENDRPGTCFFEYSEFGYTAKNFDADTFIEYAKEFSRLNADIEVTKGEGVSGLIRKADWDYIGGNDNRFNPAYFDDADLFIRCQLAGYRFITTTSSVLFHFGSRSDKSNFPDDTIIRSERSKMYEQRSAERFFHKWGFMPVHGDYQFVTYPPNINTEDYRHLIRL